jgi:outer membrane protein assembly factor BamB
MRLGWMLLALAATGCHRKSPRAEAARGSDATPVDGAAADPEGETPAIAPTRPAEGSQPRWRSLTHGPRPRGVERWRYDFTPRAPHGEPATDGRTVFVSAVRREDEGPTEGEVFAFDLRDGTLRWHVAVGGLHGEPLELADGMVLVDTIPHCARRGADTPGVAQRPCMETGPGGLVALDARDGHERFRTAFTSEALRARWSGALVDGAWWMHDGAGSLRSVRLPSGEAGPRIPLMGAVTNLASAEHDLLYTVEARPTTRLITRAPSALRSRWEKVLPYRSSCPVVTTGPMVVVPAFATTGVTGAPRALLRSTGADLWTVPTPPRSVESCGAVDNNVYWQVADLTLQGFALGDGRRRGRFAVPAPLTSDLTVALDGVFYVSVHGRLAGIDLIDGHVAVGVVTEAAAAEGLVLSAGRGAVTTRDPGLLIGFD